MNNDFVTLNSGYKMPRLGLGTWTLDDDAAEDCVYYAIKIGYRLIDTARYYRNEIGVGRGVRAGKIRSIGISNYNTPRDFNKILNIAEIVPAVIQNENHPYNQSDELQAHVAKYGAVIESWYPFGGRGNTRKIFSDATIQRLSKKYSKTPAQIVLRWHVQAGYIVIPGSSNKNHIAKNFDVFDFDLTAEEMELICGLNKNRRFESF